LFLFLGSSIIRYLGDDILRNIISNYMITWMILRTFRTAEVDIFVLFTTIIKKTRNLRTPIVQKKLWLR